MVEVATGIGKVPLFIRRVVTARLSYMVRIFKSQSALQIWGSGV